MISSEVRRQWHLYAEQQHQRGDDEEASADPEQPGQEADDGTEAQRQGDGHVIIRNRALDGRLPGGVGVAQGVNGCLQLPGGIACDVAQFRLIGHLDHHLRVHRVDDDRSLVGDVGADDDVTGQ